MLSYETLKKDELTHEINRLEEQIRQYKARDYHLNMSRGKPCKEQLDLSNDMAVCLAGAQMKDRAGVDCRNYGGLDGIAEAKELFASLLGVSPKNIIVGGNASLSLMYDAVIRAMLFGVPDSERPWCKEESVSFLCPVPGYDRHFGVTKDAGIRMISVPMTPEGPDMDTVERLAASDPSIKGIWCVPVYSNPDGITYSEETCRRLASMRAAAPDFRIFWDNAYFIHALDPDHPDRVPEMLSLCAEYGHANRVFEFCSTSKITWAGAGICCIAASEENAAYIKSHMTYQTIGPDKTVQLRHITFLKDAQGVMEMMKKHAAILRPKFETVLAILKRELGGTGIARWNEPRGGYFISLFVMPGTAGEVVALCRECGVEFTPAGASYPYGIDPDDSNIRIAPSFPPIGELEQAIEVLCAATRLAAAKKVLERM